MKRLFTNATQDELEKLIHLQTVAHHLADELTDAANWDEVENIAERIGMLSDQIFEVVPRRPLKPSTLTEAIRQSRLAETGSEDPPNHRKGF